MCPTQISPQRAKPGSENAESKVLGENDFTRNENESFAASVAALSAAFGDSTRRDIYLMIKDLDSVNVTEVAKRFSLHPNVARHHLEKLASGGYVDVSISRDEKQGAGRPSKRYTFSDREVLLDTQGRQVELLARLLAKALVMLPPAEAEKMAEEVGRDYGATLAMKISPGDTQKSVRAAVASVADALTAEGFDTKTVKKSGTFSIISQHCPFGDIAKVHPVLCAVDRGMIEGLLSGLMGQSVPIQLTSKARGDDRCETLI